MPRVLPGMDELLLALSVRAGGRVAGGVTFTILGAPRTKKNSQRILRGKGGRPFVAQSKQHDVWANAAVLQLRIQWRRGSRAGGVAFGKLHLGDDGYATVLVGGNVPYDGPVNMRALIYREQDGRADLLNYLAAVSDALEDAGVVEDDRLIVSVDGSRLLVDRHIPRVELELTAA